MKNFYVTNGNTNRIQVKENADEAACAMIEDILREGTVDSENEKFELCSFTIVSEKGFLTDLINNDLDGLDESAIYKTVDLLDVLGRSDIAEWMLEQEENLPIDMQELLVEIND
jgi:hypothetical protein